MVQQWAGSHDLPRSDRTLGPQVPVLTTVTIRPSTGDSMIDAPEDLFKGVFMQFAATTGLGLTSHILVIEGMLWDYCVSRQDEEPELRGRG